MSRELRGEEVEKGKSGLCRTLEIVCTAFMRYSPILPKMSRSASGGAWHESKTTSSRITVNIPNTNKDLTTPKTASAIVPLPPPHRRHKQTYPRCWPGCALGCGVASQASRATLIKTRTASLEDPLRVRSSNRARLSSGHRERRRGHRERRRGHRERRRGHRERRRGHRERRRGHTSPMTSWKSF